VHKISHKRTLAREEVANFDECGDEENEKEMLRCAAALVVL